MDTTPETTPRKNPFQGSAENKAARGAFKTLAEAQAVKPASTNFKVFEVKAPDGTAYFTWSWEQLVAIGQICNTLGWRAGAHGKVPGKDKVLAQLSAMSPGELAALPEETRKKLLAALTTPAPAPAPAAEPEPEPTPPTKSKGKGKQ
jgi:hypothetical protein